MNLIGDSTVSIPCYPDRVGFGIYSSGGSVTIAGDGTLTFLPMAKGGSADAKTCGATAIWATDSMVTGGASLSVTGKPYAVKADGDLFITSGGSLTAKAITAVNAGGSVTVENGSLTSDAPGTSADMGYAVKFAGDMTVSGDSAQVLVNQSEEANYAYGLYNTATCDLTIGGGTVKIANGSNGKHQAIRLQNSASTFNMTGGDAVITVTDDELTDIVEVSLIITHAEETETELHQLGGNVEVTVPYAGEVPEGQYIVVCYLSDDGNVTYVRATYDAETQQVTFITNHFSDYAVFVSENPAVVANGITAGTSVTAFSSDYTCTRAQIVTFLYRSTK